MNQSLFRYNGHSVINLSNYLFRVHGINLSRQPGITVLADKDIIWYGTRKGLYKIDKKNLSATKIFLDEPLHTRDYRNYITVLEMVNDTLYVGTSNGLYLVNKNSSEVLKKYLNNGIDFGYRNSSNVVQSLYPRIEDGVIWVALDSGMYKIYKTNDSIERYTFKDNLSTRGPYPHHFYKGELYNNTLLMPSWGSGMVKFNLKSKEFSRVDALSNTGRNFNYTVARSAIKLNDSLSLVNVHDRGNALFNRKSNKFQWLKTPSLMKEGTVLEIDRSGFVWSSKRGRIFRSKTPVSAGNLAFNHVIDITSFKANDILKNRPAIDGYSSLTLDEKEQNIHLEFSITKPYVLDSVYYEYRLNSDKWKPIETPNNLKLFNLTSGDNHLGIRALDEDGTALASRNIKFKIYQPYFKSPYFIVLSILTILGVIYFLGRYRIRQKIKTERLRNEYEIKLSKLESEALRSQINPHFIFNTLNSIKYYAVKKSKNETKEFITKFSTLIRQVLENSKKNLIPFEEELKTIKSYVEIENLRFSESFNFSIDVEPNVDSDFLIAPMVIQPFIENAIWHGLLHKDGDRKLTIRFKQTKKTLICEVEDNGIGRKAAQEISKNKSHKSSLGMAITKERLEQFETLYDLKSIFDLEDLYTKSGKAIGTIVIIQFKKMN